MGHMKIDCRRQGTLGATFSERSHVPAYATPPARLFFLQLLRPLRWNGWMLSDKGIPRSFIPNMNIESSRCPRTPQFEARKSGKETERVMFQTRVDLKFGRDDRFPVR
jgi:hypothetical protein